MEEREEMKFISWNVNGIRASITTRIEDRFKELGCNAHVMDGTERLESIYNMFYPAKPFYFDYRT